MTTTYTCGVPLCGREATLRVHFYSDTPLLIRGMGRTAKEGEHEDFCEQCYRQAGFTAESDITAIPVGDIDEDTEEQEDLLSRIWQAWAELDPTGEGPDVGRYRTAYEHGQWWVVGYDSDGNRRSWSVVEASGPGSAYGLAFEEV